MQTLTCSRNELIWKITVGGGEKSIIFYTKFFTNSMETSKLYKSIYFCFEHKNMFGMFEQRLGAHIFFKEFWKFLPSTGEIRILYIVKWKINTNYPGVSFLPTFSLTFMEYSSQHAAYWVFGRQEILYMVKPLHMSKRRGMGEYLHQLLGHSPINWHKLHFEALFPWSWINMFLII